MVDKSLEELLRRAREASPNDRIELRDAIASLGEPAIEAVSDWLTDPTLCWFAVRVIGRAGKLGDRDAAIRALLAGHGLGGLSLQDDIDAELGRLDYAAPKSAKPARPSWARADPYAVAPLPADAGLSWPGFRPNDFGDVTGTTWRRRNDQASLPPVILRALREIHPHFNSWAIYHSAEVHFALTDRYTQFDDRASAWRAAKLVVYAHGPTADEPTVEAQAIAGVYIEKGDGGEKGPVDATWDWPRFVTSLTDPATARPLGEVMARHAMAMGDFMGQRFGPGTRIGGIGRMQDGEFVFRDHDGGELFRGFAAMRHHLEQLPAYTWHNLHIWKSWSADEAISGGVGFAREALLPILTDLARIYIPIVKDALAEGVHAVHRVEARRKGADGRSEVVCLIQAHPQPGRFSIPTRVADELQIPIDGRVELTVETLEGEQYFTGVVSMRSGYEVYHRTDDEETQGLDRIGSREWLRVTVRRPVQGEADEGDHDGLDSRMTRLGLKRRTT